MAIQPINSGNVPNSVPQTKAGGKSTVDTKEPTSGVNLGNDTVSFSNGISKHSAADSSGAVNEERVAQIKAALASGAYKIDYEQTASKMMEFDNFLQPDTT